MQFIGIDVHKRIFTACILDENEKVVGEIIDAPTTEKGLDGFMRQYPPEDCRIVFENVGRSYFVFHYLWDRGYAIDVAHTGHGAMNEIANSNFKTDRIDAYKLALVTEILAFVGMRSSILDGFVDHCRSDLTSLRTSSGT